jgi:hypothetical protein
MRGINYNAIRITLKTKLGGSLFNIGLGVLLHLKQEFRDYLHCLYLTLYYPIISIKNGHRRKT